MADGYGKYGRYEEDYPFSYWKNLVKKEGFSITNAKKIEQNAEIHPLILENIKQETTTAWKEWGVKNEFFKDMEELLDDAKKYGMYWSPLLVIISKQ